VYRSFLDSYLRLSFHVPQAGASSANGQQFGFAVTVLPHRKHFPRDNIQPGAPGRQPILPRQVTAPQQAFLHTDNPGRIFAATYLRPPTPVSMRARSELSLKLPAMCLGGDQGFPPAAIFFVGEECGIFPARCTRTKNP
jgi:hypothetical protein